MGLAACSSGSDDPPEGGVATDGGSMTGGGAIDDDGSTTEGGAIDDDGSTTEGGAIDDDGSTTGGGAIGDDGSTTGGGAIDDDGSTTGGGAIDDGGSTTGGGVTDGGGTMTDGSTPPNDGNTTDGVITGAVSMFGYIEVSASDEVIEPFAVFTRLPVTIPASQLQDGLIVSEDECTVDRLTIGDEIPDDDDLLDIGIDLSFIGAGDSIVFTSPGGTYATLQRVSSEFGIVYQLSDAGADISAPAPNGLTVNIPGEVNGFPAVPNVVIPDVVPLVISTPTDGDLITPSTQFSWTSGGMNQNLELNVSSVSIEGASVTTVSVYCSLVDDGSFIFPTSVQSQMGSDFMSNFFSIYRTANRIDSLGNNTFLYVENYSGQ